MKCLHLETCTLFIQPLLSLIFSCCVLQILTSAKLQVAIETLSATTHRALLSVSATLVSTVMATAAQLIQVGMVCLCVKRASKGASERAREREREA